MKYNYLNQCFKLQKYNRVFTGEIIPSASFNVIKTVTIPNTKLIFNSVCSSLRRLNYKIRVFVC
jgi:hypothetical protein